MPFQAAPGVASVEIRATYLGIPMENVFHFFEDTTVWPPGDLVGLGASVASAWTINVLPNLSERYVVREIAIRDLSVDGGGIATDTSLAGSTGGRGGDPEPGNVAFCVSLRTGLSGRSNRGRVYLAGLTAPDVTDNFLSGAMALALVGAIDNVRTSVAADGFTMVVLSRRHAGVLRPAGVPVTVTSVFAVTDRVSTQRRRLS